MLKLYLTPGGSSMAPHIALYEIGVPFATAVIQLAKKENRTPDYLAINPEGKVPTLVIDGRPMTEVAAILFYLAKRYPDAKLLPTADVEAEAHAIAWMSFIASSVHPSRTKGLEFATQIFGIADRKLGARDWALGAYSIVDIHLFRLFWRFYHSLKPDPAALPNLMAHYTRMMARPAVKKTIEVETAMGYDLPP